MRLLLVNPPILQARPGSTTTSPSVALTIGWLNVPAPPLPVFAKLVKVINPWLVTSPSPAVPKLASRSLRPVITI